MLLPLSRELLKKNKINKKIKYNLRLKKKFSITIIEKPEYTNLLSQKSKSNEKLNIREY